MPLTYPEIEARFTAWAQGQPPILSAVVVGSRARPVTVDEWADLDLVVFTTDPAAYAARSAWLRAIGPVWAAVLNHTARGDPEWLVLFEGALKADIVLAPAEPQAALPALLAASPYQAVFARGVRVLFDKHAPAGVPAGTLPSLPRFSPSANFDPLPTAAEFQATVEGAWLAATRAARLLRRGDLWRAKLLVDCDLKHRLLSILVWHARSESSSDRQVWDDGRQLAQWADRRALAALAETFAAYTTADVWRALFATLSVFHQLAREAADQIGYDYAVEVESQIVEWLQATHQGR